MHHKLSFPTKNTRHHLRTLAQASDFPQGKRDKTSDYFRSIPIHDRQAAFVGGFSTWWAPKEWTGYQSCMPMDDWGPHI